MKITLDLKKSITENANDYYEKSKKAKRKIKGAQFIYDQTLEKINKKQVKIKPEKEKIEKREKKWYEKFHWFISSEGFLCIGGRDQTTNDLIVKKHLDKNDLVFHTQIIGSPFFIVKKDSNKGDIGKATIEEAAQATASYSKAWKLGLTMTEVYYITKDQVKHELGLPKGTFMIHGKRNYLKPELKLAIGVKNNEVIGGPVNSIKKNAEKFCVMIQGYDKSSDVAKKIAKRLNVKDINDIQFFLPAGKIKVLK